MRYILMNFFICLVLTAPAQYLPGSVIKKTNYTPGKPSVIWTSPSNGSGITKSALDTFSVLNWPILDNKPAISPDSKYFSYVIKTITGTTTLFVEQIGGHWKHEVSDIPEGKFTADAKQFIYLKNDSLHFVFLGLNKEQTIEDVSKFQQFENSNLLFYTLKSDPKKLIIRELANGNEETYEGILRYNFYEGNNTLLLQKEVIKNDQVQSAIEWVNLEDKSTFAIPLPGNQKLVDYYADMDRNQLALLLVDDQMEPSKYSIWYYKQGMKVPVIAVTDNSEGMVKGLTLYESSQPAFTKGGKYLCFYAKKEEVVLPKKLDFQLDLWNYKDREVQTMQLLKAANGEISNYQTVIAVNNINTDDSKVVRLVEKDEVPEFDATTISGDFFLVRKDTSGDRFWERKTAVYLVSMKDGTRKTVLNTTKPYNYSFWFSPNGKYLLQFNQVDLQYYSYDLQTNKKYKITGNKVKDSIYISDPYYRNFEPNPAIAGWMGETDVLVYDNFDIWRLDLTGNNSPVSITGKYGRSHSIQIRVINQNINNFAGNYRAGDSVLFSLLDARRKYNGLVASTLSSKISFDNAVLGPWSIYNDGCYGIGGNNSRFNQRSSDLTLPAKAKNNNWIVIRESATESPNYFLTNDFKSYKQLTFFEPQKKFNWLTAELLTWKQHDKTHNEGILYRPENFDPNKKYPIIITYYEQISCQLHQFPSPVLPDRTALQDNISWFVSHGYLVFAADIRYTRNRMIESTCNSIVSAAECLSLLPYVDHNKIGISGFSWGGTQTNWLVTQSDIFKAAATGGTGRSGSDLISTAYQLVEFIGAKQESMTELVEEHLGSFWTNKQRWLSVSPVLRCDKITTPILMMNNYGDKLWQQSAEIYMALRRLNKPIWMLQYDRGAHGMDDFSDVKDFTIRMTQYFDHYLKGEPAPVWMTCGIPARLKQAESGYDLDPSGNCAVTCEICKSWNKRQKNDPATVMNEVNQMENKW